MQAGKWAGMLLWLLVSVAPAQAHTLVVAPHPDDDILTSAGVILRAVQAGEPVTVVYMTNGENARTPDGLVRQAEAVAGQRLLGMPEEQLIFLGYPDAFLAQILVDCPSPDDRLVTPLGRSETYGNRGLGRKDYHAYRFGAPAAYNRPNLLADLTDILTARRPDNIYVTAEFDTHPDHAATYHLLRLALWAVHAADPDYAPVIHKTIVHWEPIAWQHPPWKHPMDPTGLFQEIPDLARTGLAWSRRESLEVPPAMQSTDLAANPKYLAIAAHDSQGGIRGYLKSYVHRDEFFWAERVAGADPLPAAEAGGDPNRPCTCVARIR